MSMKSAPAEFEKLMKQAGELAASDPSAEQVVTVLTAKGHIRWFLNHNITSGSTADEAAFIKALAESGDTEMAYTVCMWSDSAIDVPSLHLREQLMELNPSNGETQILLRSGEGFVVKPFRVLAGGSQSSLVRSD